MFQMLHAAAVLERGLMEGLHLKPLLPKTVHPRVINIFELNNTKFELLGGEPGHIQNVLQESGIFVSVKQMSKNCSNCDVEDCQKSCCMQPLRKMSSFDTCVPQKPQIYIRLSTWSFTTHKSFEAFNLVFTNNLNLETASTTEITNHFLYISDLYERLFSVLKPEAFCMRAERLRHHPIFYYAHTAVFYVNKLVVAGYLPITKRIDPRLESVMSVGVDEMSWDDMLEDNYEWTSMNYEEQVAYLVRIRNYRQQVKQLVLNLLETNPVVHPIVEGSLHWLLLMGIEHENIHLETSAVIISQVRLRYNNSTMSYRCQSS